jgi:serine/threonine protein kinase
VTTHGAYPEPGELIGPYRVGQRLGMGGMGIVFEALDTQLNRQVALKIISPHLADDEAFRARFTREAQAQASLDSPNVVHVYAHGEVDGRLYIATQLVPDGDLGQMIQTRGAPSLGIAVDVIAQIASGLADAHAAGLVHRDIKPANVLLRIRTDSVRAYLADFGIARQVNVDSNLTTAGVTVGTPTYMAPELHTGGQSRPATSTRWAACSGRR